MIQANEADHRTRELSEALEALDGRSRNIIERRWLEQEGKKSTLGTLAKEYGVSAERIRQIVKNALAEMRNVLIT